MATASGAAAITYTFQALAKAGEHIVASKRIYGGTYNLLAHTLPLTSGITASFADPEEEELLKGKSAKTQKQSLQRRWEIPTLMWRIWRSWPGSPISITFP